VRQLALSIAVLLGAIGVPCQAATLTGARITALPDTRLIWDTFPNNLVMLGVKEGAVFLNPHDEQIDYDLTFPGTYDFGICLNKGIRPDASAYDFCLFFDGRSSPAISANAAVDAVGGTPPFSGSLTYLDLTLTKLQLSTFGGVDEVGEFRAGPDGNVDYAGSFQLTVIPEPSSAVLLIVGAAACLAACSWRPARRASPQCATA